jgi:hypothetical protein
VNNVGGGDVSNSGYDAALEAALKASALDQMATAATDVSTTFSVPRARFQAVRAHGAAWPVKTPPFSFTLNCASPQLSPSGVICSPLHLLPLSKLVAHFFIVRTLQTRLPQTMHLPGKQTPHRRCGPCAVVHARVCLAKYWHVSSQTPAPAAMLWKWVGAWVAWWVDAILLETEAKKLILTAASQTYVPNHE